MTTRRSAYDPIKLEIFKHLFAAVAEEMGTLLRRSSHSPNIKERRDFSCALFDPQGRLIAQAAHIPVHLGAMPLSVIAAIEAFGGDLAPGDLILLNDPFRGGTHLPDITMVSPVYDPEETALLGFAASRAHHADVGGMTPGSMPVAREIYQEGLIIPPVRLMRAGEMEHGVLDLILANVRTPQERLGDLQAQIAANRRGEERLLELARRYGRPEIFQAMNELLAYTERTTRRLLASLPDGVYRFEDCLDDDGVTDEPVPIRAAVTIAGDSAVVDFSGSAPQRAGSVNAVYAITLSAVYYVFRCLLGLDVPDNAGCLAPVEVIAPPGTVVNARPPAPVATRPVYCEVTAMPAPKKGPVMVHARCPAGSGLYVGARGNLLDASGKPIPEGAVVVKEIKEDRMVGETQLKRRVKATRVLFRIR